MCNAIVARSLKGIAKAQKDHERRSGGCRALEASENPLAAYVARKTAGMGTDRPSVTLEHNVRSAMDNAGYGLRPRNKSAVGAGIQMNAGSRAFAD